MSNLKNSFHILQYVGVGARLRVGEQDASHEVLSFPLEVHSVRIPGASPSHGHDVRSQDHPPPRSMVQSIS